MKKTILTLLLLCSFNIYASGGFVFVTGTGATEEEAKQNAFVAAVEQTLGVMVSSKMMIDNGELIEDKIISKSSGYIESYTVLSSTKDGNLYVVSIKAKVSKPVIQKQIEEISHINDAKKSYDAVECSTTYKNAIWCRGGDLAIGDMNFGIHTDSYAYLRQYRAEFIETQLFFRLTLKEKGYFHTATDMAGKKLDFIYVYMGKNESKITDRTFTEDFIIKFDKGDLKYLKQHIKTGLNIKFTGSRKVVDLKIPGAYIEGFVNYLEKNYPKSK